MKKTVFIFFFLTLCTGMLCSATIESKSNTRDQYEDKIDISRHGGSTRVAGMSMRTMSSSSTDNVLIEAYGSKDLVTIHVQNYRGGAWVEIVGSRGARSSYFEVYEMGFEAINIGDLRPGKYTIRIIIGSEVYSGTFNKTAYGR